jgi:hypothetical protein
MALVSLTPHLTPHGRLLLVRDDDASLLEAELAHRIQNAFGHGTGHGLLHLGANEVGVALPPALSFWREFAALYVTGVCTRPGAAEAHSVHIPPPASSELDQFVQAAPPMTGSEYLSACSTALARASTASPNFFFGFISWTKTNSSVALAGTFG